MALLGKNIKSSIVLEIQKAPGLYKVDAVNLADNLERGFIDELEKDAVLIYERDSSAALLNAK